MINLDKNAIKMFATESRRQMIESVKYQANLIGITADDIRDPISTAEGMETYDYGAGTYTIFDEDIVKRESLVREVKNKGFDNVVEEVAYTWFNRIIAIRFMEVNDYLPTRIRVLSSESGKSEPDIIGEVFNLDLDYSDDDKQLINKLLNEDELDDLFKFLFIKQCNKLNEILPGLFEKTDDYLELLLNISFTNEDGVVRQLISTIPESDFENQVEIIGWLYQFYNTELKDETFTDLKKRKIKIPKERIPAATQLFTPDWIVKYMVENSLGRYWLENHPNETLKSNWTYFVDDLSHDIEIENVISSNFVKPEDIKIIDPCMGSGHILVYIFEVLMQIYISEGYTEREASELILEYNIHGLDIDDRAYQLAYFAIMMKARKYNKRILTRGISPAIYSIQESNNLSQEFIDLLISQNSSIAEDLKYIVSKFNNGKIYGSALNIDDINFEAIHNELNKLQNTKTLINLKFSDEIKLLRNILNQSELLLQNYEIVVTNPPYMGTKGMNPPLKQFLKDNYKLSKTDLFAVFIERCQKFTKENGYLSMITQHSFMFLISFEEFRKKFLEKNIINMVHLGPRAFEDIGGEVVQSVSFVVKNSYLNDSESIFIRLTEYNVADLKEKEFFNKNNYYRVKQENFKSIPGSPISYWAGDEMINLFKNEKAIQDLSDVKVGIATANNDVFLRLWYEINYNNLGLNFKSRKESKESHLKWFPYNKGGLFRKWYGNQDYVVNWENDGEELRNFKRAALRNPDYYFKHSISWSLLGSPLGARFYPDGFLFDVNGSSLFISDEIYHYVGGFLCSNIASELLSILNPTLAFQVGNIKSLPIIIDNNYINKVNDIVLDNINLSKRDWDDSELSWNFSCHPLIKFNENTLEKSFASWVNFKENQFNQVKSNEIKLNKLFSEIYGLNMESDVDDKYISISKPDYVEDIKSFISYSVGCMFGRYSLDEEGLQFAGGKFDLNIYNKFSPDDDNIIPVLDTEYFEDDIVGRFVDFVAVCFGEERKEENLDFIAGALNKKGKTSREKIRNYFLSDFFKDHVKKYNKVPIYWQFDSGKQNAFKCLIYMHRYESDLVARVRTDYLHKTQKAIEQNLAHCEKIIANSSNKSEVSKATKDKSKYIKQLDEIKVYDEALGHIANQHIEIDLDHGVKVNHAKFQKVEIAKEGEKVKKINLLKNI